MRKVHFSVVLLLMGLLLVGIAACGESPTATPVPPPPTATAVPATNTPVPPPPTNTPVPPPPTDTAVPPTNTAAVVAPAPTDTAVAMMPESTATAEMGAMPTSMAGGAPTAVPGGMMATSADMQFITDALTATQQLKSYHFTASVSGSVMTATGQLEGDYVAPDKAHVTGTMGGQAFEEITTGGKTFDKQPDGKWVLVSDTGTANPTDPVNLTSNADLLSSLSPLLAGMTQLQDAGTATVDGTSTRHFIGTIDAGALMGGDTGSVPGAATMSLGSTELWIDPSTKYVRRLSMNLDLAPFIRLLTGMFAGLEPSPGPGTPTATPIPDTMSFKVDLTISKPNDSSITIPPAPTDYIVEATPTLAMPDFGGLGLETPTP